MWLNKLKLAIVKKDMDKLDKLLDNIPEFSDPKDMETVKHLIKEASTVFTVLRDETLVSMKKIKNNLKLIGATQNIPKYKLDIKS